jgi:putative transposase
VHENVLRKWVKEFGSDPVQAFPGHGQMKPEQQEIARLRREVNKLKAERDILKKAAAFFEGSDMKFVFIAKHRTIWPVAWLCDALGVSRSGFHAWLNRTPSVRSRSEEVLGQCVKASFVASDRTYGARRVCTTCWPRLCLWSLHRIERLMQLQALRARPAGGVCRRMKAIVKCRAYRRTSWIGSSRPSDRTRSGLLTSISLVPG